MIVVATWPMMLKVQARLKRRSLAVVIMSGAMVLVFVVPLMLAIGALVDNADTIAEWARTVATAPIPPPPEWLARIPLVGAKLTDYWATIAATDKVLLLERLTPYASTAAQWLAGALGSFGVLTVQFLLTVVITVIMYINGEAARDALIRFGGRLAGERGKTVVILAGQAIRAVALGVVVTALAQTILAGIGLALAGIPFAGLLTGVILLLCIAQIGPILVLAPAVIWLFWSDQTGWGVVLLDLDGDRRHAGQHHASAVDTKGCGPAVAAHFRGRDRRAARVRHHRSLRRTGRACRDLHVAERVDARARRDYLAEAASDRR